MRYDTFSMQHPIIVKDASKKGLTKKVAVVISKKDGKKRSTSPLMAGM